MITQHMKNSSKYTSIMYKNAQFFCDICLHSLQLINKNTISTEFLKRSINHRNSQYGNSSTGILFPRAFFNISNISKSLSSAIRSTYFKAFCCCNRCLITAKKLVACLRAQTKASRSFFALFC